jgi:hypothetical protein
MPLRRNRGAWWVSSKSLKMLVGDLWWIKKINGRSRFPSKNEFHVEHIEKI